MYRRKHMIAGWLVAAALVLGARSGAWGQDRGPGAGRPEVWGVFKAADVAAGTITVAVGEGRNGRETREPAPLKEETLALAKDVEVAVAVGGGAREGRGGVFKEIKLAALAPGVRVGLTLSADHKAVESIVAEGPMVRGQLKAVEADKNVVTIQLPGQGERGREGGAVAGEEKTFGVAADAEIAVDDGRGGRFSIREAKVAELAHGALVTARLSVDLKQIQFLLAEGPTHQGIIKAVDADKKTLTLVTRPARGEDAGEEHALVVFSDATILLDDGRGRRLSLKQCKLADVPVGSMGSLRLSADQNFVMMLRVEGPTLTGRLRAVDPDKSTLVLAIPKERGEEPEEKSLSVAKDARVMMDGTTTTLADLKVGDDGPLVQLRLSLDQKTVQSVGVYRGERR